MRAPLIIFLLLACLISASACAQIVLLADPDQIEAKSSVCTRMRSAAEAAQLRKLGAVKPLTAQFAEALAISMGPIRSSLPQLIKTAAQARKADVVLTPIVAKRIGVAGVDITGALVLMVDAAHAKTVFVAPR